jgi:hypothetical protein
MDRLLPDPRPQRLNETALFLATVFVAIYLTPTSAMASNEPQSRMQMQNRHILCSSKLTHISHRTVIVLVPLPQLVQCTNGPVNSKLLPVLAH